MCFRYKSGSHKFELRAYRLLGSPRPSKISVPGAYASIETPVIENFQAEDIEAQTKAVYRVALTYDARYPDSFSDLQGAIEDE